MIEKDKAAQRKLADLATSAYIEGFKDAQRTYELQIEALKIQVSKLTALVEGMQKDRTAFASAVVDKI